MRTFAFCCPLEINRYASINCAELRLLVVIFRHQVLQILFQLQKPGSSKSMKLLIHAIAARVIVFFLN